MTMITPSYLGETIEYSSLHACRSTLEDPTTNNGAGVASLGFPLQLVVAKTNDSNGNATDYQVAQGIYDVLNAGVRVISMSLAGPGYSESLQQAMDAAWEANVLVIAAAGNTGDTTLMYPGAGNHVLAVGATDSTNTIANFSTYGDWVRIAAPGVNVYSTVPTYGSSDGSNYNYLSGTSMATPHVAALAGLLFAANPGISAAAVAQRIQQTAQSPCVAPLPPTCTTGTPGGWDQKYGYGMINAAAAMGGIPGPFTTGSITGQVITPAGDPLTGATISAGGQSYTTVVGNNTGTPGDDDGLFRIAGLAPGTYPVSVSASSYSTINLQAVVVAGADSMLAVQMGTSYGEFSGVVTHNGVGVAGAVVEAVSGGQIEGTAITNSSGSYTLFVPAGTYTLTASALNYVNATSGSQSLSGGGTVTLNLTLSALGNLIGTVTDVNGLPIPNAHIDFTGSSFTGGAVTGPTGTYSTYGIPAGTYTVTASASGYTSAIASNVSVTNNTSTLVNFKFSTGIALTSGLLGYWPLNEGSGTVAHDQSGNHYDATLSNTTWGPGLITYALDYNGTNSWVTTPNIPFGSAFSVSAWVNPAVTTQTAWAGIAQASSGTGLYLGVDSTGTKYKLIVDGSGETGTCGAAFGCAQGGTVTSGWHQVAGTYDGASTLLYVDGVLVASDTSPAPPPGSFSLAIGGSWTFSTHWNGAMDEVRLYGRALTASEVSSLFNQATSLSLTKTADAANVTPGNAIGYTLSATNTGSSAASSTVLNDALPTGSGIAWSISPAYSGTGTCAIASGTLSCNLGSLAPGGTASVHVTSATNSSTCGAFANTATLSAANAGTVQSSATTTVNCGQTVTFLPLSNQVFGTAPFTVSATASSGLAVSFSSLTTPVCTVSGNTVTLVMGGACTIQATQAGNGSYPPASASQSFTVTPEGQTITFGTLASKVYGSAPFTVSATASSGLAVSFSSLTPPVCTVSGNTVTLVMGGACTIQATQNASGSVDYSAAAPVSQSFTVTPEGQTITFGTLSNQVYGTAPFTVSATASSGLAVSFSSLTTPVCTVSGNTVTQVMPGTCTIQATQNASGSVDYSAAAPVSQSFTVTPASQTITFGTLSNQVYGSAPFTVSATASSGLAVSFSSLTTPVCTVSGNTVTLVMGGACTIQATQNANGSVDYSAATPVSQSFTVTPASQTITFGTLANKVYGSAPFTVSATASSGLAVRFSSLTTPVCTVSGNTVTIVMGGACTIQATQNANGSVDYSAAAPVSQSFTVTPASQTITFGTLSNQVYGTAPLTVSATASSGLAVSFGSLTTSVCTVSSNSVTLVMGGACTIQATVAGNADYSAATASQSFTVTPAGQSVTFGTLASKVYGSAPFTVSATASSGLAVSFGSLTTAVCTVSGNSVTLVMGGTCTIQATAAGNADYSAAAASQSFTVTPEGQTVTFAALPNQVYGTAPFTVNATASSALAVTFGSLTTSVCTVSGNTVTLVMAGACTIQATQAGNASYSAASANQSFTVTPAGQTITFGTLASKVYGSAPFTVSATASSGLAVSFGSLTTTVCTVSGNTVTLVMGGTCTIQASQGGNASYSSASANQSFTVTPEGQTIAFGTLSNQPYGTAPFAVSATASSTLAVSFSSLTTSICTVSGSTVTLVMGGACTIQATQGGNASYSAASANQSFTVTPAGQTITFGTLANKVYGSAPFTVSATASSTLAVSFGSLTTSVCTVSGSTVTLVMGGACTIQAAQAGNADYSAATANQSFTVTPQGQTVTFAALANQVFGASPFAVNASASSTLAVSFSSLTTSVCTVSSNTVTLAAGGLCTIQASQGGNASYSAASANQSFTVTPEGQTIAFAVLANKAYGSAPFAVSATASSTLSVSFGSLTTSVCTVSGNTVTLVAGGACTIQAAQAGNASYSAATASQSFAVTPQGQTITFAALANQPFGTSPFTVSATTSSPLTVSFNSQTGSVCTVSGNTVTLVAGGTCTIQATQAGNATYAAASANQSFTVTPQGQTITFAALANQPFGTPPFPVSASTTSPLTVSFNSQTGSVCTVSGNTVTLAAGGTCTIQAIQTGNASYSAASASQSFTVTPEGQTITFAALANRPYGTAPFTVSATTSSPLTVSFNSQTGSVCTVSGNTVTLIAGGTCTIQAIQAGNASYSAASASQSFTVTPVSQTITFGALANQPYGTPPFTVSATITSPLTVSFNSQTGSVCSVSGNTVTLVAGGTCTIQAIQAGNASYSAASASQTFTVTPETQTITFAALANQP